MYGDDDDDDIKKYASMSADKAKANQGVTPPSAADIPNCLKILGTHCGQQAKWSQKSSLILMEEKKRGGGGREEGGAGDREGDRKMEGGEREQREREREHELGTRKLYSTRIEV